MWCYGGLIGLDRQRPLIGSSKGGSLYWSIVNLDVKEIYLLDHLLLCNTTSMLGLNYLALRPAFQSVQRLSLPYLLISVESNSFEPKMA